MELTRTNFAPVWLQCCCGQPLKRVNDLGTMHRAAHPREHNPFCRLNPGRWQGSAKSNHLLLLYLIVKDQIVPAFEADIVVQGLMPQLVCSLASGRRRAAS